MTSTFQNIINSPVNVTALGFDRRMQAYPRRMEWQGSTYYFTDSGIRVRRNNGCTLTMSDGARTFCLRFTAGAWTLVSVG
jgi:hypothetical protein